MSHLISFQLFKCFAKEEKSKPKEIERKNTGKGTSYRNYLMVPTE